MCKNMWLLRQKGYFSLFYLDDFVGIESSKEKAVEAYHSFFKLTENLGLVLALDKCTSPVSVITWLGFMIDVPNMSYVAY